MATPFFRFRQFTVWHDRCGLKVGTDGVLIGAWADLPAGCSSALDIGAGTGLISLMMAQRCPEITITAVEIDREAAEQCMENVRQSPFDGRISTVNADFSVYSSEDAVKGRFDVIVSNPPFFILDHGIGSRDAATNKAKHTDMLSFSQLLDGVALLLTEQGRFSVIIPYEAALSFIAAAAERGLFLSRRCDVRDSSSRPYKRVMLTFRRETADTEYSYLTLHNQDRTRTTEYYGLTREFYLPAKTDDI